MSVHIRQVGDFTRGLGERLGVGPSVVAAMTQAAMKGTEKDSTGMTRGDFVELDPATSSISLPNVRIDGPYGAPAEDVFNSQVAILIGAGIGKLAPFVVVDLHCKNLFFRCNSICFYSQAHLVQTKEK